MKGDQLTENEIFINVTNQNMLETIQNLYFVLFQGYKKTKKTLGNRFLILQTDYLFAYAREKY